MTELRNGAIALTIACLCLLARWLWRQHQRDRIRQRKEAAYRMEWAQFGAAHHLAALTDNRLGGNWRDIECSPPDRSGDIRWHMLAGLHEKVVVATGSLQGGGGLVHIDRYQAEDETWIEGPFTFLYSEHVPIATATRVMAQAFTTLGLPTTPDQVEPGDESSERGLACFRMGTTEDGIECAGERLGFGYVMGSLREGTARIAFALKPDGTKVVGIMVTATAREYRYWHDRNGRLHLKPLPQA